MSFGHRFVEVLEGEGRTEDLVWFDLVLEAVGGDKGAVEVAGIVIVDADPCPTAPDEAFGGNGEVGIGVYESGDDGGAADAEVFKGLLERFDFSDDFDHGVYFRGPFSVETHFVGHVEFVLAVVHDVDVPSASFGEVGGGDADHA